MIKLFYLLPLSLHKRFSIKNNFPFSRLCSEHQNKFIMLYQAMCLKRQESGGRRENTGMISHVR